MYPVLFTMNLKPSTFLTNLFIWILFTFQPLLAQLNVSKQSFHFPQKLEHREWKNELNLTLATLPEDYVEEVSSYVYAPLFSYETKFGLPYGLFFHGGVSTNFITEHYLGGLHWGHHYKKYAIEAAQDIAWFRGGLNAYGFKSNVNGWMAYNSYVFGIAFEKFTLTLKQETSFVLHMNKYVDDIRIQTDESFLAASAFTLYIEQPLWKDHFVTIGLKANYARFYYPLWAAFTTWERYYFIPEVIIGFIL